MEKWQRQGPFSRCHHGGGDVPQRQGTQLGREGALLPRPHPAKLLDQSSGADAARWEFNSTTVSVALS